MSGLDVSQIASSANDRQNGEHVRFILPAHRDGYVAGSRTDNVVAIEGLIKRDKRYLLENLPKGTIIDASEGWPIILKNDGSLSDVDRKAWLVKTLNAFANVLRPRLRKWYQETRGSSDKIPFASRRIKVTTCATLARRSANKFTHP
jgi:hypothetical protein